MDLQRANGILRYAIGVLRGFEYSGMKATPKGRLQVALILRDDLIDMGAVHQARILEYWLHRFQRGDFSA